MHKQKKFTEGLLNHDLILEALSIMPGQTVVDAGCGSGYLSELFSKAVTEDGCVYALDRDRNFISSLKERFRHSNVQVMEADITIQLPLENACADLVFASTVIHTFSRKQVRTFVRESIRVLKMGGRLAILEIEKKETPFGPPINARFCPEDLKRIVPMTPVTTAVAGEHFYMQLFKQPEDTSKKN